MKSVFEKAKVMVYDDESFLCVAIPNMEARRFVAEMKPIKYSLEIKEYRERRSLDANAYCWVLLDKLAEKLGVTKTEVYRAYIREIGGNSETVCVLEKSADKLIEGWSRNGVGWFTEKIPSKIEGCVNVVLYYGSSTYDTEQMARLIDLIVQDCRALGIETLPPYKLAALVEEWK